jgi:hypothetical protein
MYLAQNQKTAYRIIKEEAAIVDLNNSMLYSLNSVATLIWEMSDGRTTIEKILDKIEEDFDVERAIAEKDCMEFINDFVSKGILVVVEN